MRFQKFLRSALVFAAGFLLCVYDHFGIGMPLILIGLFMFCLVPSASESKQTVKKSGKKPAAGRKNYPPVPNAPAPDAYAYSGSVERYFSELLHSCFPSCAVQENVSPASLSRLSGSVSWACECGVANTGKFCSECGKPRPASSAQISTDGNGAKLSFVLYQNGTPAAAVILCNKYAWDTAQVRGTIEACRKANIPCLRFMKEFRNSAGYVVDRINSVLR